MASPVTVLEEEQSERKERTVSIESSPQDDSNNYLSWVDEEIARRKAAKKAKMAALNASQAEISVA